MLTTTFEAHDQTAGTDEFEVATNEPTSWAQTTSTTNTDAARYCHNLAVALNATSFSMLCCGPKGEALRLVPVCDDMSPMISVLSRALSAQTCNPSALLASRMPAWWRQSADRPFLAAEARRWAREIECPVAGTSGIAFPVSVERGRSGVVVFTGPDMAVDEVAMGETHARCHAVFSNIGCHRAQMDGAKTPSMSKREIECLRLTANGMTSEEIAAALGLSVHTANQYLTNSTHKLNAVNRIHAVAKALRSGLID